MFGNLLSQGMSEALNSVLNGDNPLVGLAQKVLEDQGGVVAIVAKFQEAGLAELVSSWIGTGENLPVSIEQLKNVFSPAEIEQLAAKFGIENSTLLSMMSQFLPQLIDSLTPKGKIE